MVDIRDIKIFIDPGHGGPEERPDVSGSQLGTPGYYGHFAPSDGYYEKDANLEISLKLESLLQAENVTYMMSRRDDIAVSLMNRVHMANDFGADIFISIHNNAINDPDIGGTMVLFPGRSDISKQLAVVMSREISNRLNTRDIGAIERNDLVVLRETKMTAVLVEAVFMTNLEEYEMLQEPETQWLIAEAIIASVKIHIQQFPGIYERPITRRALPGLVAIGALGTIAYFSLRN